MSQDANTIAGPTDHIEATGDTPEVAPEHYYDLGERYAREIRIPVTEETFASFREISPNGSDVDRHEINGLPSLSYNELMRCIDESETAEALVRLPAVIYSGDREAIRAAKDHLVGLLVEKQITDQKGAEFFISQYAWAFSHSFTKSMPSGEVVELAGRIVETLEASHASEFIGGPKVPAFTSSKLLPLAVTKDSRFHPLVEEIVQHYYGANGAEKPGKEIWLDRSEMISRLEGIIKAHIDEVEGLSKRNRLFQDRDQPTNARDQLNRAVTAIVDLPFDKPNHTARVLANKVMSQIVGEIRREQGLTELAA